MDDVMAGTGILEDTLAAEEQMNRIRRQSQIDNHTALDFSGDLYLMLWRAASKKIF